VTAAVAFQRELAIEEDVASRRAIEEQGCEIAELSPAEHAEFAQAVEPLLADARKTYGKDMFAMMPAA
jgi:TRAP-type C4-dicarboxylate transport system substrate-binding protein